MKRDTMTKVFSTTLSLALAVSSMPLPAPAAGPIGPGFAATLTPPSSMGYIASTFAPNDEVKPRLIVISDLHGHLEVQRHVMGILDNVMKHLRPAGQAGKPLPIFVEGGWEPGLGEPLRLIKDPAVRSFMAEYYLQKAEINASQAYSEKVAGTGQVTLIGAENKDEYLANKARFVKTYPERKALLLAIQREEAALAIIEEQVSGRAFKRLQEARADYLAGRIEPGTYARTLVRAARRLHLAGKAVDILQNAASADSAALEMAFSEVYRSVIAAAAEQKPLTALLREPVQNEDMVRQNLARIDASLDLLKRLVGNQLTPEEVPLALARMPELVSVANMLLEKSPMAGQADKIVRESFDFYPFAMVRDDSLTDNSIAALDRMGQDATGILVAGGFHTDAIVNRLREKHISYMLIHPVVSRDLSATEQLNYIKRVCDDHVTAPEILRDIDALRHGGVKRLAEAAVGPVSDLESEKPGNEPKMLGGIADSVAAQSHLAMDAAVLANLIQTKGLAAKELPMAAQSRMFAASQQLAEVMGWQSFDKIAGQIKWNDGIEIRQLDGVYNAQGDLTPAESAALAAVVNEVSGSVTKGLVRGPYIGAVHIVPLPDAEAIKKLGAEGKIFWRDGDSDRTMVLSESRFESLKHTLSQLGQAQKGSAEEAAIMRTLNLFVHELVHAFDAQGKSETSTILKGVAISAGIVASRFAGEGEARDAVARFVGAITPQLGNSKGGAWLVAALPDLAETIANLVSPSGLSADSVQAVVRELAKKYPEQSNYTIEQVIQRELDSTSGRIALAMAASHGDPGVPKKVADEADGKLKKIAQAAGEFFRKA